MRRMITLLGLAALVALGSDRALTGAAGKTGGGDRWQFRLRLSAPEPSIQSDPAHPEDGPVLAFPTFDRISSGGRTAAGGQAPLPVKVVRVAIPEGGVVSLESIQAPRRLLKGLRLGSAKAPGRGRPEADAGPTAAPAVAGPTAASNAAPSLFQDGSGYDDLPVRLGQTGYFRYQKFVELIYTPVGRPAGTEVSAAGTVDLEFYPEVEADLVVTGASLAEGGWEVREGYPDRGFEDAYRKAFINYDDGRAFRVGRRGAGRSGSREEPSAPLDAATLLPELSDPPTAQPEALSQPSAVLISPFAGAITPVYKLGVTSTGIYRMSQPYLTGPSGVAPGLAGVDPRKFRMLSGGVEVPIRVVGEGDGTFGAADFVEFLGEGLVGEPDVVLNIDFCNPMTALCGFPNIFQANDLTDENVYFLFAEDPGPWSRVPDLPGAFDAGLPLATSFAETIRREEDSVYSPLGVEDPFFQIPALRANNGSAPVDPNAPNCGYVNPPAGVSSPLSSFSLGPPSFSADPNNRCAACELSLPGLLSIPDPATLRFRWRGATATLASPDHLVVAQIGLGATTSWSAHCFDNAVMSTQTLTVPQSALVGQGVFLESPGMATDTANPNTEGSFLDYIEVDYKRSLALAANELIARGANDVARSWQVDGFATGSDPNVIAYDISRVVGASTVRSPRRVTGGTIEPGAPFRLKFSLAVDATLPPAAQRVFAFAGAGGFKTPARVTPLAGDDLLDSANAADFIVIGHPDTVDLSPGSAFSNYLAHRAADSELTTKVVMIDDIYEQFNHGVESPEGLRVFLAYAFDNWVGPSGTADPPSYVMLVGDISLDFKNRLNRAGWVNQIPTFLLFRQDDVLAYHISDNSIAAFRGSDQLPDVHLGRITVRDLAESNAVFSKLLDYGTSAPSGAWRSRGLFIADRGKSCNESNQFEGVQNGVMSSHFQPPFAAERLFLEDPNYGGAPVCNEGVVPGGAQFRADISDRLTSGYAMASFLGHGAFQVWGDLGYYDPNAVEALVSNDMPAFLVNENCLMGGFHTLGGTAFGPDALGEAFLKAPNAGAVAIFAPAGLSSTTTGERINQQLYPDLMGITKERRFGHLMTNVRVAISSAVVDMQNYVLLGDPAQRLILPAPRPPADFTATGGDAQVSLTWALGPDPGVTTRIYRTIFPTLPYTLLTPAGVAGTSYIDTAVTNGTPYFYRAVSLEAGAFEGALTNLNSDCDFVDPNGAGDGPDCRRARPINPSPPSAPTGFNIFNHGSGDRLRAVWNPSPEPDIESFTLSYGTVSGVHPFQAQFPAGSVEGIVGGLQTGIPYFFVLRATNLSGVTSDPTPERFGIPEPFEGISPPAMIADLAARRSPTLPHAVELSWSAPAFDINGGPTTAANYKIYRGSMPGFVPLAANRIATLSAPATLHNDPNAYIDAPNHFYLVTATDVQGFTSGAGRELPQGISDLTITRTVSGSLLLAWPAATHDVMGAPTLIDHYDVYVDTSPVGRERIDTLAPAVANLTVTSVEIPDPGPQPRFVSVIVVDIRGNKSPF